MDSLLGLLGLEAYTPSHALNTLAGADSRYLVELRRNVESVLHGGVLSKQDAAMIALVVASNERHAELVRAFENSAALAGATIAEIAECHACASLMSVNNVFYRFKHYMRESGRYATGRLGMRAGQVLQPVSGHKLFELMGLAASVVNGCEDCVVAHEHSATEHGATVAEILDTVRLAAVIKGLCVVI